jgi:Tol biopolymer transport system component
MTTALAAVAALTFWLAPHVATTAAQSSQIRFAFSTYPYRVSEGDGVATVTVVRTGDTTRAASVEYLASSGYLMAQGCGYLGWVGSASASDYEQVSGTLTFAAGETSKTFQVKILEDALVESRDPETIFLSLDFSHLAPAGGTDCYGATGIIYLHDNDPTPSPTPTPVETGKRKLAFASNRDGNYELYVMDEDGMNVRRLTNTLVTEGDPAWSPDGKRLAFTSTEAGVSGIYLMNAGGSNVNKLPGSLGNHPTEPAWSPDGTRIAYTGSGPGLNNSEVYVTNVDGSGTPLNVSNNPGAEDFNPAWSPDGTRLAFTSRRDNGTYSVYVVNADGTNARRIVEGYSRDPAWSPDGTRIAYTAEGVQPGSDIYVVNADGTEKKLLSGERAWTSDFTPSWSSDGARIAFTSSRDNIANHEIYVMNSDGAGQTRVTDNNAHESSPVWQPQAAEAAGPALLTEPGTTWAVALDSVTQVADPFPVVSASNFSADRRTRVALFATGVGGAAAADITAEAEDSAGRRYTLPVEHAATLPGLDWLTQVTVRLPDDLDGLDYVWVSLNVRGALTNKAVITLRGKP